MSSASSSEERPSIRPMASPELMEDLVYNVEPLRVEQFKEVEMCFNTFVQDRDTPSRNVATQQRNFTDAEAGYKDSAMIALDVLTAISELHPFIKAPVSAFKLVVTLHLKHRGNNSMVTAVTLQMQSMMTAFLQLSHVKQPPKDLSRMEFLMADIADDIKHAAAMCDWYLKKSFIKKMLKANQYEALLLDCMKHLAKNEDKIQRALALHTVGCISDISEKLDILLENIQSSFSTLRTEHEKETIDFIESNGGPHDSIANSKVLQELVDKTGENENLPILLEKPPDGKSGRSSADRDLQKMKETLLAELREDINKALAKNYLYFERKLAIQLRELNAAISAQGDRIIKAFYSGGHDRILDLRLREIWKEMGWKGTVKARHFVLALRDYFMAPSEPQDDGISPQKSDKDGWANVYINVSYLQAISESIDDDGSGFINVKEVNDFTTSCPPGWTLLEWLAYWAAGWHSSVSNYKVKIYQQLRKMNQLRDKVRPDNRKLLDIYLSRHTFYRLELLLRATKSINSSSFPPELIKRRDEYSLTEETRIEKNVEDVSYIIDQLSTVSLVTGPGRIERFIYPLIFLLLKRHTMSIHLACRHTIHPLEFEGMAESLDYIFSAFNQRLGDLSAVFRQMHIDPESHLKNYAFGMFTTSYGPFKWDISENKIASNWEVPPSQMGQDDNIEICPSSTDISPTILRYGIPEAFNFTEASISTLAIRPLADAPDIPHGVYGDWTGYCMSQDKGGPLRRGGVFRIRLTDNKDIVNNAQSGKAEAYRGSLNLTYIATPLDENRFDIDFVMTYDCNYGDWIRCKGVLSTASATVTGTWYSARYSVTRPVPGRDIFNTDAAEGNDTSYRGGRFILSRTPARFARFRYREEDFLKNRAKARWSFACSAALYLIRSERMSLKYVTSQFKRARRFKELSIKRLIQINEYTQPSDLTEDEQRELWQLEYKMCPLVDRFYFSVASFVFNRTVAHWAYCDKDLKTIQQSRYICIICIDTTLTNTLDLCTNCCDAEGLKLWPAHTTSHSLIRVNRVIQDWERASLMPLARKKSEALKAAFYEKHAGVKANNWSQLPDEHEDMLCSLCNRKLCMPFWVCLECENQVVCSDCDTKYNVPVAPEKVLISLRTKKEAKADKEERKMLLRHAMHVMLRIKDATKVEIPHDDALTRVENRLNKVEDNAGAHLQKIEQGFHWVDALLTDVVQQINLQTDKRFQSMEKQINQRHDSAEEELRTRIQLMEKLDTHLAAQEERVEARLTNLESRFTTLVELLRQILTNNKT